ncbi:hypothetical protein ACFCYM_15315 [Streptomyces sp. NPDC056254]|uniref:hypothetical protein n=1 Tax=Streptomyces sp. NPDC056254 TaxID=3345763 RepID=UPI0035DD9931
MSRTRERGMCGHVFDKRPTDIDAAAVTQAFKMFFASLQHPTEQITGTRIWPAPTGVVLRRRILGETPATCINAYGRARVGDFSRSEIRITTFIDPMNSPDQFTSLFHRLFRRASTPSVHSSDEWETQVLDAAAGR